MSLRFKETDRSPVSLPAELMELPVQGTNRLRLGHQMFGVHLGPAIYGRDLFLVSRPEGHVPAGFASVRNTHRHMCLYGIK